MKTNIDESAEQYRLRRMDNKESKKGDLGIETKCSNDERESIKIREFSMMPKGKMETKYDSESLGDCTNHTLKLPLPKETNIETTEQKEIKLNNEGKGGIG